ncbi:DNA polymerase III subunit gamma/tau [Alicyclobacillus sp. SO9]|nr:DNA polymerase III subunit gamma/tau [Alicyclobacillus sp. SO9]
MSYQALYRMWRPQTFRDLIGQPHVKQTLVNALQRGQVAHAYLFAGPRGTGKTSAAKILAKAVNCLNPLEGEPCNECEACTAVQNGTGMDVEEIDAASNRGVDEIRQLREKVQYAPTGLTRKVYIVDEVHMLTTEAFNALLKTLEEPPNHTLFVLATTEPHKIPGTIISRCQRFDFRRIAPELMVERLETVCSTEGWTRSEEALWKIAQAADGGLRDALGLLEQTSAFGGGDISSENAAHVMGGVESVLLVQLLQAMWQRDMAKVLNLLGDWYERGKDATRIVHDLLQILRDLVIIKMSPSDSLPGHLRLSSLQDAAQQLSVPWLMQGVKKLGETYTGLRYVDDPRLALEAALLALVPRDEDTEERLHSAHQASGVKSESGVTVPGKAADKASASTRSDANDSREPDEPAGATGPSGRQGREAALAPEPSATTLAKPAAKKNGRTSESRKQEVLRKLATEADNEVLERVQSEWQQILQRVKDERIQTHAWLMNGQPVLATKNAVVVVFSSRFHRDAVMKPDERTVIEQAFAQAAGISLQMLALLKEDWEKFQTPTEPEPSAALATESDLAEKAVRVFGKDLVEIIDGE